jgi:amidophosphoribosyltransferase
VLQHRGQDAAGIMTSDEGELFMRKDSGLVRDVFQQKHMLKLKGNVGIGHVRYPTAGATAPTMRSRSTSIPPTASASATTAT